MKTWFITGTSSGFGRTLTEKLLARFEGVVKHSDLQVKRPMPLLKSISNAPQGIA